MDNIDDKSIKKSVDDKSTDKSKVSKTTGLSTDPKKTVGWSSIVILILGAVVVIYSAVAPGVDQSRRIFGVVMMLLWSILWALILWVLWKNGKRDTSWILLIIPVTIMLIFFVFILIMNIGTSI